MTKSIAAYVIALAALTGVALGQTVSFGGPSPFPIPAVAGAPYSGDEISEHSQTLADGTHIARGTQTRHVYRDSQGRTRIERPLMAVPQKQAGPVLVEILDPVAGFQYTLDTQSHVAHRVARPIPASDSTPGRVTTAPRVVSAAGGGSAQVPDSLSPQFSSEALGQQLIEGVMTEGRRTTTTFRAGSHGNDRPIVTTSEQWFSKELRLTVLTTHSDPRSGETTNRLTNISRTEPDPALFQVPPDYTTVDETGPFTIQYKRP